MPAIHELVIKDVETEAPASALANPDRSRNDKKGFQQRTSFLSGGCGSPTSAIQAI
jgi:hypothetical protein